MRQARDDPKALGAADDARKAVSELRGLQIVSWAVAALCMASPRSRRFDEGVPHLPSASIRRHGTRTTCAAKCVPCKLAIVPDTTFHTGVLAVHACR
ncbi:hypothetical protein SPRG_11303 [Saprolegnia parasitica CBS 223.65]|uniref:Uncharacterized protein n=1 Tax=Saprolegnia parasitica (strain CBS 223.65) TaxID=695850 RepID=A0A067C730_SAPPC|nr:hypothetical protein SPRG_11303 [Saprolegnia parasitica CBS 223.65]KDO22351.1 hypothetical protein SPRG_11303 [Saprolegnia parasitica CBS 223.65]|eukprot:XP_012206876.1 hypothetical protein SPRG_11303 [Saprolegnia parasitica CBS 223.65]